MYRTKSKTLRNFRRLALAWRSESDLERLVAAYHGPVANKWRHFYPIYGRHFGHLRGQNIRIFEIGVAGGGSLALWRRYFGDKAEITGLDIDPAVAQFEAAGTRIYIGDQGDPEQLRRIGEERGPFDLVIEDGSHAYRHQILAFQTLFDFLKDGGQYACEDIHTSYLADASFGGGVGKAGTFVEYAKGLVDAQHEWFSTSYTGVEPSALARQVYAVHFYPCLAIVEKRPMTEPTVTPVGRLL